MGAHKLSLNFSSSLFFDKLGADLNERSRAYGFREDEALAL